MDQPRVLIGCPFLVGEGGKSPDRGGTLHQARGQALRQQCPAATPAGHADTHWQQVSSPGVPRAGAILRCPLPPDAPSSIAKDLRGSVPAPCYPFVVFLRVLMMPRFAIVRPDLCFPASMIFLHGPLRCLCLGQSAGFAQQRTSRSA